MKVVCVGGALWEEEEDNMVTGKKYLKFLSCHKEPCVIWCSVGRSWKDMNLYIFFSQN